MGQTQTIMETNFAFPGQVSLYHGKVRDVYNIEDKYMVMIATDRLSAFDVILPKGIPFKGSILNQLADIALNDTKSEVPNWVISSPDPNVTIGYMCEPFKVEVVVRGYLSGHAWREYKDGKRELCGQSMPDGLKENDKFPAPIITPTTKADTGHDEDISESEILKQGLVSPEDWEKICKYALTLFAKGTEIAKEHGLILVDTKYEFGKRDGNIYVIDEIHTPDCSRFFYSQTYNQLQAQGKPQRQLSKEFAREWFIEKGWMGKPGETIPELTDDFIAEVSNRYIELYRQITGKEFTKAPYDDYAKRIEHNVIKALEKING